MGICLKKAQPNIKFNIYYPYRKKTFCFWRERVHMEKMITYIKMRLISYHRHLTRAFLLSQPWWSSPTSPLPPTKSPLPSSISVSAFPPPRPLLPSPQARRRRRRNRFVDDPSLHRETKLHLKLRQHCHRLSTRHRTPRQDPQRWRRRREGSRRLRRV